MEEDNRFERLLRQMQDTAPRDFYETVRDVADTAYVCKLWFQSYGLEATASDIVAMARLVSEREAVIKAEKATPD